MKFINLVIVTDARIKTEWLKIWTSNDGEFWNHDLLGFGIFSLADFIQTTAECTVGGSDQFLWYFVIKKGFFCLSVT
jgi:hypothetical protein